MNKIIKRETADFFQSCALCMLKLLAAPTLYRVYEA